MAKCAIASNSHETIVATMDILREIPDTPEPVKKPRNVANKQPKPVNPKLPMQKKRRSETN